MRVNGANYWAKRNFHGFVIDTSSFLYLCHGMGRDDIVAKKSNKKSLRILYTRIHVLWKKVLQANF